jgi:hypothetical protein
MTKTPMSTTGDSALPDRGHTDHRDNMDAAYAKAYAEHPIDEPDAWGDLASWSDAARAADRDVSAR